MQAKASIIKVTPLVGKASGKPFVTLDLAENFGKGEDRETTYYKAVVFKEELIKTLKKGQFIEFKGFLSSKGYAKHDGSIGSEINVRVFSVTVLSEPKDSPAGASQPAGQPASQPASTASSERSEEYEMNDRYSAMADSLADCPEDLPF